MTIDEQPQQRRVVTRRATRANRNRTEAIGNLQRVTSVMLQELDRRFALVKDDNAPRPGSGGSTSGSIDVSGPTLRTVVRSWDERNKQWRNIGHDEVAAAIAAAFEDLEIIERLSEAVEHRCQFVMSIGIEELGRQSDLKTCTACQRTVSGTEGPDIAVDDGDPDMIVQGKLLAGYCPSCYRQWVRQGRPDRFYFERARAQKYAPVQGGQIESVP